MPDPKPTMLYIAPLREWIASLRHPNICPDHPANRAIDGTLDALERYISEAERGKD